MWGKNSCNNCICRDCLYWWSSRCPYGRCYDDHRAQVDPYDKAHPGEPPRTSWSDWEAQQAYWCRGGIFYPVGHCGHYVEYKGQQVRECLKALVSVFQDGYIWCSLIDCIGCQKCYEEFEKKMEKEENGRI